MIKFDINLIIYLNKNVVDKYGGEFLLLNKNSLESSIYSVYQTFDKEEIYKTDIDKLIRLSYLITKNHCFIDGNKRTGFLILIIGLNQLNLELNIKEENIIDLFYKLASSKIEYTYFYNFIINHLKSK